MAMVPYQGGHMAPSRLDQEGTDPSQMFGDTPGGAIIRNIIPAGLGVLAGLAFGGGPLAMAIGGALGGGRHPYAG